MRGPNYDERAQNGEEKLIDASIVYDFAVSVHEVTMEQFRRFKPDAEFALDIAGDVQCPANKVSYAQAIQYCQWLSAKDGLADQMCYGTSVDVNPTDPDIPAQGLSKTGYRLLTEAEWECVCRAGSATPWFSGVDAVHLRHFAWFALNTDERLQPVGTLRPNLWGLFDTHGNAAEWCHTSETDTQYALRGGSYYDPARSIRSAQSFVQSQTGWSYSGFRLARTLTPIDSSDR
jgi:formylglycine-generating enzyme required for sulfatase activity